LYETVDQSQEKREMRFDKLQTTFLKHEIVTLFVQE